MPYEIIDLPTNKKFGIFFSIIFLIIGFYLYFINLLSASLFLIGVSIIFFIVALVKSEILMPLNKAWMRFGMLLGIFVNPIIMGIIFFTLLTPMGLLVRIFGRDELHLRVIAAKSHWKQRDTSISQSFKNQF